MKRSILWTLAACVMPVMAAAPPNIVIMLADDLGWADVGYHSDRVETPHIDRLAREGIELDHFYVAPMCSPTRAGLMTGRYPIRFGLARAVIPPHRDYGLPVEERTMAEALGAAGYVRRGVFGKWHLGHARRQWHPLEQGFTDFEGHYNGAIDYFTQEREGERDWHVDYESVRKDGYSTDLIADAACRFIKEASKENAPYFCYVPFNAPHSPFQAKEVDLARFRKQGGTKDSRELILKAMIWSLDQGVGRILQVIEKSGEAENTQVWLVSDNGGIGGVKGNNLPLRGNKLTTFEGGVRTVACVRWPAAWKGGRKLDQTIGYIDVLPTVLTAAGVDPKAGEVPGRELDGVSLCDLLAGKTGAIAGRDWYSYHGQGGAENETIAIKTAEWKLQVVGSDVRKGVTRKHQVRLFKMPGDPFEEKEVAQQHPEVVATLVKKLKAHRALQPADGVRPYAEGRKGFVAPKDWRIPAGR